MSQINRLSATLEEVSQRVRTQCGIVTVT
jgi:hypothetical protein